MPGYIIAEVNVTDPVRYEEYRKTAPDDCRTATWSSARGPTGR